MDEGHLRETLAFPWVAQVSMAPAWPYLKNHWLQPWYGYLYIFLPNTWLDSTDPTFAGRGA